MNKKNKNKNSRKWLALFLCVAMVATSGVIAVSPGLRAAEDNDAGAASQQTQTEQTVSDQTESGASRHESSSQDKKTGSDEKESSSSQKSDEKASEDKAQTGSSDKTISDDKSGSSEQEIEKKSDEKADKDRADNEKTEEKDDKQDADNADEEQTEEVKMPAQSFSGSAGSVTVSVSAPEGALPEDSSMRVTAVSSKTAKSIAKQTASGEVKDAVGVDISFRNADGKETEPARAISVSMSLSSALDGDNFTLSHRSDNGNVTEVSANVGARGAKFSSSSFSIYVIAGEGAVDKPVATYNFHGADGSVIDTQKVKTGDTLNKPESPEKDGYKFTGWSESSEAIKADFSGFGEVTVTEEKTIDLYPVFEEAHYVFFMDSTSSDTARVYETKSGVKGDKIDTDDVRLPLASTENVAGWYDNSSLQGDPVGSYVTLGEKNIYLYPDIKQGHYLYFDTDGGSYIEPQFVSAGKKTVKPDDPERAGYTFEGWTTEEGGNYSFGETITGDVTLKAEWKARKDVKYTIIYWCENANDEKYSFEDFDTKEGKAGDQVDIDSINKPYEGFTLNSKKTNEANAGVTISGDGSTIINVYFNRNIYNVTFYKSTKHQSWWGWDTYTWDELTDLTIQAKYGANIADKWPSSTSKIWGTKKGDEGQGAQPYQSGISTMPLGGASFYYVGQSGRYTMNLNYYLEGLDGKYILDHTDSFKSDNDRYYTSKEDHYDIEGFTYTGNVKDGTKFEYSGHATYKVNFAYSRNSYDINFINGSTKTKETFKYGADISGVDLKTAPERPGGECRKVMSSPDGMTTSWEVELRSHCPEQCLRVTLPYMPSGLRQL